MRVSPAVSIVQKQPQILFAASSSRQKLTERSNDPGLGKTLPARSAWPFALCLPNLSCANLTGPSCACADKTGCRCGGYRAQSCFAKSGSRRGRGRCRNPAIFAMLSIGHVHVATDAMNGKSWPVDALQSLLGASCRQCIMGGGHGRHLRISMPGDLHEECHKNAGYPFQS